jgi:hypothetical protein
MSSRGIFVLFLILMASRVAAQDWESFAASSNRSADPLILQAMAEGDLETNIALCKGLARRSDGDVRSILETLAAGHAAKTALTTELLLRYLLQGVLDANPQEASLRSWVHINADSIDGLLMRIAEWRNPQLKGALLVFACIDSTPQSMRAIMEVGASVVHELQASDGLIPSQEAALILDFLNATKRDPRFDFFEYCSAIARLSRDKVIVDAARSAAATLASAP